MSQRSTHALIPASYVYLRRGDDVLLQCRANTGYMDGCWVAGAAGHVELGESAVAAAVREADEELGIRLVASDLDLLTVMQRTDGTGEPREQRVDWFWTARSWVGDPRIREPAKCSGLAWHPLSTLPDRVPDYERWVLAQWRDGLLSPATWYGPQAGWAKRPDQEPT